MKTVAVVCEYNPFHFGHLYQIEKIKEAFGSDTAIIAIMSGNFTQRGDLAVLGKFDRARIAVDCGVSLVLELPFPYSCGSAEYFANAAVDIAHRLGCIDYLSFGSECGDIARLQKVSDRLLSPAYQNALAEAVGSKKNVTFGHAVMASALYASLFGDQDEALLSSPNNILALEYMKALSLKNASILPHTIARKGTDEDTQAADIPYAGATYIRNLLIQEKYEKAFFHLPEPASSIIKDAILCGRSPVSLSNLSSVMLSAIRMGQATGTAESAGGLAARLQKAAAKCASIDDLITCAATKKFTHARIRRALLFSYFGVTPAMLRDVGYTQVLAMDSLGQAVLHNIRKSSSIPILTKPADVQKLPLAAQEQASIAYRADSVYALASPTPQAADIFLRTSPYRK